MLAEKHIRFESALAAPYSSDLAIERKPQKAQNRKKSRGFV
jgi:hypothetical protein